jgi:hypothetical protein
MEKKRNLWVTPTDKPSRIYMNLGQLFFEPEYSTSKGESLNQNIYITSDEEISGFENDIWVIQGTRVFLWKNTMALFFNHEPKKIILTTDQDLIKDGVQAIDDEFLEWFVKNPSCEFVNFISYVNEKSTKDYEIIIPKEIDMLELGQIIPKEEPKTRVFGTKNDKQFWSDKPKQLQEPKQETLEFDLLQHIKFCLECGNESQAIRLIEKYGFEKQEGMYSEEQVITLLKKFKKDIINSTELDDDFETLVCDIKTDKWFEQFKKK